jgi:2-C-methyl-D-erythritol 4-phosphate cytidylyltransferase
MGGALPKQFMILDGMPIVARTINTFAEALPGSDIVVVLPEEHIAMWQNLASRFDVAEHRCVAGGKERFHSVKAGIEALSGDVEYIAIHDGVRALATKRLIIRAMLATEEHKAVIPVIEVVDSYRQVVNAESRIIDRSTLRIVQTPQIFEAALLRRAYEQEYDARFTDDASVVEAMGVNIALVEGERSNIKITTPDDMEYAEWLLHREER